MANLIFASEYVSKNTGAQMWHVYATRDGKKVANTVNGEATVKNEFYFYEPLKALRFAFLLRKRLEGSFSIPKGVYNKLMAAIKAAKPAAEAEQGESAPVPTATESTTAPEEAQPEQQEPAPEAGEAPAVDMSAVRKAYKEMKVKHPDAILLYRVGDFYESYADDAKAVAEILGIVLTTVPRVRGDFKYMAGFPAHALDSYLPRLVRAGKRVAICDAMADMIKKESK